jgi:hypothetical protein
MPSLRVNTNNAGNVEFSWGAVNNSDGYEVSRSTTMIGGYSVVNAITVREGSRVKITDSSVRAGTAYFYSVRAFRVVNGVRVYGEHSEILSVTTA